MAVLAKNGLNEKGTEDCSGNNGCGVLSRQHETDDAFLWLVFRWNLKQSRINVASVTKSEMMIKYKDLGHDESS